MPHLTSETTRSLAIAVLTVSDTRTTENDTSGDTLAERASSAGHNVTARALIKDDIYRIRAICSQWIADENIQVILITGGTGFTERDSTPEAVEPLFDKKVEGFGELFRQVSYTQIGTSTIQSRAVAGMANRTLIFCLPGSTNACKTAWDEIIQYQLDSTQKPCNFVPHLKK
jgi:molybdopterin adenylyltransferase